MDTSTPRDDEQIVDATTNPSYYLNGDLASSTATKIENTTTDILTIISNIGIAVSVIILAVLGVKYMLGSVEEKAEYKEDLIPYLVGAMILFGITTLVKILVAIGNKINLT